MLANWGFPVTLEEWRISLFGNPQRPIPLISNKCNELQKNSDKSGKSREKLLYLHNQ